MQSHAVTCSNMQSHAATWGHLQSHAVTLVPMGPHANPYRSMQANAHSCVTMQTRSVQSRRSIPRMPRMPRMKILDSSSELSLFYENWRIFPAYMCSILCVDKNIQILKIIKNFLCFFRLASNFKKLRCKNTPTYFVKKRYESGAATYFALLPPLATRSAKRAVAVPHALW